MGSTLLILKGSMIVLIGIVSPLSDLCALCASAVRQNATRDPWPVTSDQYLVSSVPFFLSVFICVHLWLLPSRDDFRIQAAGNELALDFGEAGGEHERLGQDLAAAAEKIRHQHGRRHPVSAFSPRQQLARRSEEHTSELQSQS